MTHTLPFYAELDCISNFSFLRGASHPEELVERAARLGYGALALGDECSLAGIVAAHKAASRHGLALIAGSRFRFDRHEIIILARNMNGYGNLCELVTLARSRAPKGQYRFDVRDLLSPPDGLSHLRAIPDCLCIIKPGYNEDLTHLESMIMPLCPVLKGRLWLGLIRPLYHADFTHRQSVEALADFLDLPVVALGQVEMHVRSRQSLHDVLTAIRLGRTVQECGQTLRSNAEHHLRSRLRLAGLYPAQALEQTRRIAQSCTFSLDELRYHYPLAAVPPGMAATQYLARETWRGAKWRYPQGIPEKVGRQLRQELAIIAELGYEAYFLTVHDIVRYARSRGILCQGRGSAANSAVCYCLGITEVDPESSHLLFARFISRERNEPPDIDVDFEHHRREEIIQYIYHKYGADHAALAAVTIRYRRRSALRDAGLALGLDENRVRKAASASRHWSDPDEWPEAVQAFGFDADQPMVQTWIALAAVLVGFPRHLSQHPGGFVIARQSLTRLVPIENAAMAKRRVVQWNKDDLDAMGMLKIDVLALGMLSVLQRCLQLSGQYHGRALTLQDIPRHDDETFRMIQKADTIGVFQIESRAQMSLLPRLKPENFYDLVIQIAIVRPGPIQGGMVHPYLERRKNPLALSYPRPELRAILARTLGVVIFQEQAMQVAMTAAGFSADEADSLRRSMAAWNHQGEMNRFRDRLITGMLANGYTQEFAENLYRQLEGFGEYGFPESHSASFAKLAWFSAWFKCHEPAIFLVALLNSQPMGFYAPAQLIQDAQRHGVTVLPVDVLHSLVESSLEDSTGTRAPAVRLGLDRIKHLKHDAAQRIMNARRCKTFTSIQDLAVRARLSSSELRLLASVNALSGLTGGSRRQALWEAANPVSRDLLETAGLPEAARPTLKPMPEGQRIINDYALMDLSLERHPLALLRSQLQARGFIMADTLLKAYPDRRLARACGLVTARQRPQTAKGTVFVTLEDESGHVNVIVHADLARRQRTELTQSRLLGVYGVWQRQQSVCMLRASRLVCLDKYLGQLQTSSRDFQ